MAAFELTQLGADVFIVRGRDVNWLLARAGTDLTLIDAGYPGYVDEVEASIRAIGSQPGDVRAILLTHAHVDHLGAVNHFHKAYSTPVYLDPVEVAHARRDYLEQATPLDVARNAWRPGVLPWALRVMRAGATSHVAVPYAQAFPASGPLDLPGRPVPVATHGHTSGHTAYLLPHVGAVATGDGLVTGHAVSSTSGPQILSGMFNHGDARSGLKPLADLDADWIAPGHGPAVRMPIAEAVRQASQT